MVIVAQLVEWRTVDAKAWVRIPALTQFVQLMFNELTMFKILSCLQICEHSRILLQDFLVAQVVERKIEDLRVGSSSLSQGTKI